MNSRAQSETICGRQSSWKPIRAIVTGRDAHFCNESAALRSPAAEQILHVSVGSVERPRRRGPTSCEALYLNPQYQPLHLAAGMRPPSSVSIAVDQLTGQVLLALKSRVDAPEVF